MAFASKFAMFAVVVVAICAASFSGSGGPDYSSVMSIIFNNVNDARKRIYDFDAAWDAKSGTQEAREARAQTLTNEYYDMVTDFYEYGWGQSFHFGTRVEGESFTSSLLRHEYKLAVALRLDKGKKVLDVGCGVGGPARNIARFTGTKVTGLNNNKYQISRAEKATKKEGLEKMCNYQHGDFMAMPFQNNTFDAVYAIEATCHAPDKVGVFSEIFRVLKPGGRVAVYEWIMTDKFNPDSEEEQAIKLGIEHGDGLPHLPHWSAVTESMEKAGLKVVEHYDLAEVAKEVNGDKDVPWYQPLEPNWSIEGIRQTPLGRWATATMVRVLEFIGLAPAGTYGTTVMLEDAAVNLVKGGVTEIFTPMYFAVAEKPLE